jgi:hypothetical protein
MGYTTEFEGQFNLDRALDLETFNALTTFADTRHGGNSNHYAQYPGFYCQWVPTHDRSAIQWDGGEKFYEYVEWLEFIIAKFLKPKGYVLNGSVSFRGENFRDAGTIICTNNVVQKVMANF